MERTSFALRKRFPLFLTLFIFLFFVGPATPTIVSETLPLIGVLENPQGFGQLPTVPFFQPFSGITTIHGWALDGKGITKVELFIDEQFVANIPYGSTRMDVKNAHPDYPNAENSGFSMIWNYSVLTQGPHILKVTIHNQDGQTIIFLAEVLVAKFHGEFVSNVVPNSRLLENNAVTVDGITKNYDIKIEWSNQTQGFQITDIIPK